MHKSRVMNRQLIEAAFAASMEKAKNAIQHDEPVLKTYHEQALAGKRGGKAQRKLEKRLRREQREQTHCMQQTITETPLLINGEEYSSQE